MAFLLFAARLGLVTKNLPNSSFLLPKVIRSDMRCHGILVLLAILSAVAPAALAADGTIQAAENKVSLGVTAGYGDYEENIVPQDTEGGPLVGLTAGVSSLVPGIMAGYRLPDLYTDVNYDFSNGFLSYRRNPLAPGDAPFETGDGAQYNTAIVRLGAGAAAGTGQEIIPYIAGGYQNWRRSLGGGTGYGATYQAGLVGGGLKLDVVDDAALVLSAAAEGFAVVGGSVSVPSENLDGSFGASAEERISLGADYRLNRTWHAFAGLGITHYEYTGSKTGVAGNTVPLSTTFQLNSMFGVAYGF